MSRAKKRKYVQLGHATDREVFAWYEPPGRIAKLCISQNKSAVMLVGGEITRLLELLTGHATKPAPTPDVTKGEP